MAATVQLEAHPHQPRIGEWCDRCHGPWVAAFDLSLAGPSLRHLGTVTAWECQRCGNLEVTR